METFTGIKVGGCRLGRELGRGGAGVVYRAEQLGVNRPVAVKVIPAAGDGLASFARFQREAEAAGALDHPHCLPVYAAGEQDGLCYLVMRLVDGPDLAELVRREGPLKPARAVALITQVAAAVDHAHRAGLIHRDLKPANILIETRAGRDHAFVSDFGLMRAITESDEITVTGQWVGTPQYAAPEQQRGETVSPAADIYALGRVLGAALGDTPPPAIARVINRAMDPDPAVRFPTATALARAARAALAPPSRRLRRGPLIAAGGLVAITAAAAVAVALAVFSHDRRPAAGSGTTGSGTGSATAAPGGVLSAPAFSARLPAGWTVSRTDALMGGGYHRSVVEDPSGGTVVDIDRTPNPGQTVRAHYQSVEAATAATPGYQLTGLADASVAGRPTIIWSFSLAGQPHPDRVDVFRAVGDDLYAVLGMSDSSSASRAAATGIADSLTAR